MTTPGSVPFLAIFCDLLTDTPIDILPMQDVTFDDYIGKPGSLSGTIPVPDAAMADRARRVQEGRTSVYVLHGGDLWWGGIIWTTTLTSDDTGIMTLAVQAATFDSYASRRIIREDLTYQAADDLDQLDVARDLWRQLQSYEGGDILVTYGGEVSGVHQSVSWLNGDETVYYDALQQIASVGNGFEYWISVFRDPDTGQRVRLLRLGYPCISTGSTDLVMDRPGQILSYEFPGDATRGGTTAVARGGTVNDGTTQDSRPVCSVEEVAEDLIQAGYPRIDLTADYDSVTDQAALNTLAVAELAAATGSVVIPSVVIKLDDLVPPALMGRTVRVRITDQWYPQGLDARYRIVGTSVTPAERGQPDTIELFLVEAD